VARYQVWLYTEQRALVEVDVTDLPDAHEAREKVLTEAALAKLDESGGAEWETTSGWMDYAQDDPAALATSGDSPTCKER
jgi:hypothetical protein